MVPSNFCRASELATASPAKSLIKSMARWIPSLIRSANAPFRTVKPPPAAVSADSPASSTDLSSLSAAFSASAIFCLFSASSPERLSISVASLFASAGLSPTMESAYCRFRSASALSCSSMVLLSCAMGDCAAASSAFSSASLSV